MLRMKTFKLQIKQWSASLTQDLYQMLSLAVISLIFCLEYLCISYVITLENYTRVVKMLILDEAVVYVMILRGPRGE